MIYIINFSKFLCSIFLEELYYLIMIYLLINFENYFKKLYIKTQQEEKLKYIYLN